MRLDKIIKRIQSKQRKNSNDYGWCRIIIKGVSEKEIGEVDYFLTGKNRWDYNTGNRTAFVMNMRPSKIKRDMKQLIVNLNKLGIHFIIKT